LSRISVRIVVRGMVQGVMFRVTLTEVARANLVDGWVRNRADGAVEAILEGEERNVREVVRWSHRGPQRARVDHVVVSIPQRPRGLKGFRITG
jgi:acylphosphatase